MGDSGTQKIVATSATAVMIAGIQKSQWIERLLDDRAGDHDRDAGADADQRGEHPDRAGHPLASETRRARC